MNNFLRLVICIFIPQAVGIVSGLAASKGIREWYPTINKPAFTPPGWIFGPVWTALYLLMGIASYVVWRRGFGSSGARIALVVFWIHLAFNGLWSFLFFGLRSPVAAFCEIIVLLALIVVTVMLFRRVSPWAGILMVPYAAWVCFAAYLNYSLWALNR